MSGSFSNEEQAKADPAFFDMRLHIVPVWTERDDGLWFYAEQSMAMDQEHPFMQKVYRLIQSADSTFRIDVAELTTLGQFVGEWKKEAPLSSVVPESLTVTFGCAVILKNEADSAFDGTTEGKQCESTQRGANYSTLDLRVTESEMIRWDRGFETYGKQIWGSEKGGYIFRRFEP